MASRARIIVRGTVQGVGFRPHAYRLARALDLKGWVSNTTQGVVVEVEGPDRELGKFMVELRDQAPPRSVVEEIEVECLPPVGYASFVIEPSPAADGLADQTVPVTPDVATCDECRRELFDPSDRRWNYSFVNCTNCGPRFTIVQDVPYDRPRTTMSAFTMCPDCEREYHDPTDRRFHAQPNACPRCGPHLSLVASPAWDGMTGGGTMDDMAAIREAAQLLASGSVVAVRGVGGFHLAADATNPAAVESLRARKRRVDKPFAVMVPDVVTAELCCRVSDVERELLESPEAPIVLLRRRSDSSAVCEGAAPGNNYLGVMLPYTPLHHLLLAEFRRGRGDPGPSVLVMTSGNVSEEPISTGNAEALERLAPLADYFLVHNREIQTRCDDSVVRSFRGHPLVLRRSRGYAPSPLRLVRDFEQVLACGADLKNAFVLTRGDYAFLSHHIGDLDNQAAYESYCQAIAHYERLFRITPEVVAYDLHPDYLSTQYARERLRVGHGALRACPVQHHHAHFASCLADNDLEGTAIGVAFDGTGYGLDGAVWGGEFFVGDCGSARRVAHLGYVPLPGGDVAVRRPVRMALTYLLTALGTEALKLPLGVLGRVDPAEVAVVRAHVEGRLPSPATSSCGRLFDGVAALLGVRDAINYEGQAAIELEMLAAEGVERSYEWGLGRSDETGALVVDVRPLIRDVVHDLLAGAATPDMAAAFHNTVARMIAAVCVEIRKQDGLERVCLSGGVFQNVYLLERTLDLLVAAGFDPFIHRRVPPNDGGIALGQAAVAAARR